MDYDNWPDDFDENGFYRSGRSHFHYDQILSETPRAWFIRFPMKSDLTNDDVWLPKSQCDIVESEKTIEVPEWLIAEKNLEEYTI